MTECVRTTKVHPLPDQLYGGLSPVNFQRGHVEIVDEKYLPLQHGRAKDSLPPSVQFGINQILMRKSRCNMLNNDFNRAELNLYINRNYALNERGNR